MRRVVVTGLGLVTPVGTGVDHVWQRLLDGKSGITPITKFDVSDLPSKIGGQPPLGELAQGGFNPSDWMDPKDQRKNDRFILYGMAAAQQAIEDAGWQPQDEHALERTGVMIGSGIGGLETIYDGAITVATRGPRKLSPFFIPAVLINLVSGQVSIRYGFKGPNHAVVTACSTGAHAIGDAARMIMLDDADVMIAGGAEAAISRIGLAGFCASRALSTSYNDQPEKASRPWDKGRDGFVMGEGAGVVVLEEYEHAKRRGAPIYAEVLGYGLSGDAYHVTAPPEDGNGGYRAMEAALKRARLNPSDIDYINAHGTSTPLGDVIELGAVKRLFGDAIGRSRCLPPSRPLAICWGRQVLSKRSSACRRSGMAWCRRRSISMSRTRRRKAWIWCRMRPRSAPCAMPCPIPSDSAGQMPASFYPPWNEHDEEVIWGVSCGSS